MEIWQAVVLGLVQGLTEFLPVSSSGHLAFIQGLMGLNDGQINLLLFNILLHVGTLVAVCAVFWRDIIDLFKKPFKTLLYLIVATIPAGIVGLLFMDWSESLTSSGYVGILLASFFALTAVLLFVTELVAKRRDKQKELSLGWRTTVPMGLAQAVAALFPGLSRSGSTICAGVLAGGRSEDLSRFSFLMSIPVILGSFAVSLVKGAVDGDLSASVFAMGADAGWCIALGFIVAAVSGLFAIKVMIAAIRNANYKWFSLYLVLLAVTCIVLHCTGHL